MCGAGTNKRAYQHRRARDAMPFGEFQQFVKATGYVTVAERPLDPALFPGVPADELPAPGSMVFTPTGGPVDLARATECLALAAMAEASFSTASSSCAQDMRRSPSTSASPPPPSRRPCWK